MSRLSRQLLKVIEWTDDSTDTIAYRFPMDDRTEIMNGSQLIVRESQMAVLVSSGKVADIFAPGRYKLETKNLPILTTLNSWKYGFNSPFKAEVYYINTRQFFDQKWGTPAPVIYRDQEFGMIQFRAFGIFTFRVGDVEVFVRELLGTRELFSTAFVFEQLRKTIASLLSEAIAESKLPISELAANYSELGEKCEQICEPKFAKIGMKVVDITVQSITLDEQSTKALTERSRMNILGNPAEYAQYKAADAMMEMSKNAHLGSGNSMANMGMGLSSGMAMGGMFAKNMASNLNTPVENKSTKNDSKVKCGKCGAANNEKAKFCCECGNKMQCVCPKCNHTVSSSSKFCSDCGANLNEEPKKEQKPVCPACGSDVKAGAKFCTICGQKI